MSSGLVLYGTSSGMVCCMIWYDILYHINQIHHIPYIPLPYQLHTITIPNKLHHRLQAPVDNWGSLRSSFESGGTLGKDSHLLAMLSLPCSRLGATQAPHGIRPLLQLAAWCPPGHQLHQYFTEMWGLLKEAVKRDIFGGSELTSSRLFVIFCLLLVLVSTNPDLVTREENKHSMGATITTPSRTRLGKGAVVDFLFVSPWHPHKAVFYVYWGKWTKKS